MGKELLSVLERIGRPRILVIGDLILDRYLWGEVDRISPEAPIPILRVARDREEIRLGGAGSVVVNLATLGAHVAVCGVLGDDEAGRLFKRRLEEAGVETSGVFTARDRRTTLKTRMIARVQQVLRVDEEEVKVLPEDVAGQLRRYISRVVGGFDIVLVSDYDKGLLRSDIFPAIRNACRKCAKRVVVDPAREVDFELYRGAYLATPNRAETELAIGEKIKSVEQAEKAARSLREKYGFKAVVVTLDKEGMALLEANGKFSHFPTRPRMVYDVTGAGDMVLSVIGFALAGGVSLGEAARLANIAGGMEVERIGVAPLTRSEIRQEILEEGCSISGKIKGRDELKVVLDEHRRRGETIAFTNGCFDLLHIGHLKLLEFAKRQANVLVVGINSDRSVHSLKGPGRPIFPEAERAQVLASLTSVDYVTIFEETTPGRLIELLRPDVLVKGEDWREKGVVGRETVESYGGRVIFAPLVKGVSTTGVLSRIRSSLRVEPRKKRVGRAEKDYPATRRKRRS